MNTSDLATLVKQSVDIVDVIGQFVPLRRAGNRHTGLCPFHQEKTPSFHVDPNSQFYHCFGCGSGGDVFKFVMQHQNLSFSEALKYLADRYHLVLPEREAGRGASGGIAGAAKKEREEICQVLEFCTDYFYRQLHHSALGRSAREYLLGRALPDEVVETERIGYAAQDWDGLLRHMKSSGVDPELGIKAGALTRSSRDSSRIYDRFRNRLIFPIRDERGQVVAFGGRSLSNETQDEPKYLNSPETPVYHKGRMLYQLSRAREGCRQVRQVVLVEGYMDLLAFHAQGFHRVVATLGTALTLHQVRLMGRMADEVVLAYDSDEAGEKAMLRALPLFLQEELAVGCVFFPAGMDPDDYLRREGLEGFEAVLRKRQDLGIYAIRKILQTWDGTTTGKAKVLKELQPIFEAARQPVLRAEYLRLVADRLSVTEAVIQKQFQRGHRPRLQFSSSSSVPAASRADASQSLEESVLRLMIRYPELIQNVEDWDAIHCFQETHLKAIAERVISAASGSPEAFSPSAVYDSLQDNELKETFTRLLLESSDLSEARIHMRDWLEALSERRKKRGRLDLNEALRRAEQEGDVDQVRSILSQIQEMCSTRKKVKVTSDNV